MKGRDQDSFDGRRKRRDRLIRELEHDPYKSKLKLSEPTYCPRCEAVYQNGRWQWLAPPEDAATHTCPACRRLEEGVPGGYLTVEGPFLTDHRDEITHLIRNVEAREKTERPLLRIMDLTTTPDGAIEVTFTDAHLARGAGEALHRAYQGELDYRYQKEEAQLRVYWRR